MFGKYFWLTFALKLLLAAAQASACSHCRRSPCVYQKAVVAPIVATPIVNTYVVNNTYPAPLVAGGSSAYVSTGGYQSATLPLFDPQAYLSSSLELQRAVTGTMNLASQQANALAQRAMELQAPALERLAAGQAASMVLQAAGLDPKGPQAAAQSFVVRRETNGALHVEPLSAEQIERITLKVEAGVKGTSAASTAEPTIAAGKYPLLVRFCGQCHGLDQAAPKGGVFLGDDDNAAKWMREHFFDLMQQVDQETMPPASAPQPTRDERAALLNEIESIITARKEGLK